MIFRFGTVENGPAESQHLSQFVLEVSVRRLLFQYSFP